MFELAMQEGAAPISLKQVAGHQGLSENYLEQLMGALRRAGLVHSVRGAQGGYLLGRAPERITTGDIIRALEGSISMADCAAEDGRTVEHCGDPEGCMAKEVWVRVSESIANTLDSITLADLCREAKERQGMYYI